MPKATAERPGQYPMLGPKAASYEAMRDEVNRVGDAAVAGIVSTEEFIDYDRYKILPKGLRPTASIPGSALDI